MPVFFGGSKWKLILCLEPKYTYVIAIGDVSGDALAKLQAHLCLTSCIAVGHAVMFPTKFA
jgi:soluble P-type ATPase